METASAHDVLEWAISAYGPRVAIATSFQSEGMVVIDIAARISREIRILTLDTGRLPEETFQMIETVRDRYGLRVETVSPDPAEVEAMVALHGPDLFYGSVPQRSLCCEVRKVRPLERRLRSFDAWITGLRREQSDTRASLGKIEPVNGQLKINPLADWTKDQVEAYTIEHNVPRHPLYARGYTSIGCAPCTRATALGQHERAGRWWWEQGTAKECGIHFTPDGKAERAVDVLLREVLESARA